MQLLKRLYSLVVNVGRLPPNEPDEPEIVFSSLQTHYDQLSQPDATNSTQTSDSTSFAEDADDEDDDDKEHKQEKDKPDLM